MDTLPDNKWQSSKMFDTKSIKENEYVKWTSTYPMVMKWLIKYDTLFKLVEVNVSFKFEGNPSISKGVIEQTRHNV